MNNTAAFLQTDVKPCKISPLLLPCMYKTHLSTCSQSNSIHTYTHIVERLRQALDHVSHLRKKIPGERYSCNFLLVVSFSLVDGSWRNWDCDKNMGRPSTYESKLCCTISLYSGLILTITGDATKAVDSEQGKYGNFSIIFHRETLRCRFFTPVNCTSPYMCYNENIIVLFCFCLVNVHHYHAELTFAFKWISVPPDLNQMQCSWWKW